MHGSLLLLLITCLCALVAGAVVEGLLLLCLVAPVLALGLGALLLGRHRART